MGFNDDKRRILEALLAGVFVHESRDSKELKNLLSCEPNFNQAAYDIVKATRGNQAKSDKHHMDQEQPIWILKPVCNNLRWYVKCYIDRQTEMVCFISFHHSEEP